MSIANMYRMLLQNFTRHRSPVRMSVRLYARWSHRKPAKTLLPFEPQGKVNLKKETIIDLGPEMLNKTSENNSVKKETKPNKNESEVVIDSEPKLNLKKVKSTKDHEVQRRKFYISQKKVFDDNNEIIYEKLKENDSRISSMLVKLKSKKERIRNGQVLVEGWRLIVEGIEANCKLSHVIFSRTEDLNNLRPFLPKTGVILYKIPYKEIELWSDVETSPGIFGVFEMPTPENVKVFAKPLPLRLICDNIRVPGNLGAILRVAVGAGCEKVILTKGCVDLWDPKVIRSAAGAHFRLAIHNSLEWDDIPKHLEEDTSVFIADSNTKIVMDNERSDDEFDAMAIPVLPYYGVEYSTMKSITVIIGGETEGISEDSYKFAASRNGLRLNIPLHKGVDSLNTGMATAVIAFEIRKQLWQALKKAKFQKPLSHMSLARSLI